MIVITLALFPFTIREGTVAAKDLSDHVSWNVTLSPVADTDRLIQHGCQKVQDSLRQIAGRSR